MFLLPLNFFCGLPEKQNRGVDFLLKFSGVDFLKHEPLQEQCSVQTNHKKKIYILQYTKCFERTLIHQGCIKLFKKTLKDIYYVTKAFYFK